MPKQIEEGPDRIPPSSEKNCFGLSCIGVLGAGHLREQVPAHVSDRLGPQHTHAVKFAFARRSVTHALPGGVTAMVRPRMVTKRLDFELTRNLTGKYNALASLRNASRFRVPPSESVQPLSYCALRTLWGLPKCYQSFQGNVRDHDQD